MTRHSLPVEADDHFDDHRVTGDDVCHWSSHAATQQTNKQSLSLSFLSHTHPGNGLIVLFL